jgi:glucan biosynthesis protein C
MDASGAESPSNECPPGRRLRARRAAPGRRHSLGSSLAGLQVLRLMAMLLVCVGHASISYSHVHLRNTFWLIYDGAGHPFFGYLCCWINGIAMPLFFLLTGLSAAHAYGARGPQAFFAVRVRRLLGPLVFGLLTIVPLSYLVWAYGLLTAEQVTINQIARMQFSPDIRRQLVGPLHLWFLEYLLLLSLAFGGLLALGQALARHRPAWFRWVDHPDRVFGSAWRPLLLALPSAMLACLDFDVQIRLDNSFVPDVMRLLHYAVFFFTGAWLSRSRDLSTILPAHSKYLVCAVPVFVCFAAVSRQHIVAPLMGLPAYVLAISGTLFTWLTIFGLMGLLPRHWHRRSRLLGYLSEASFWIYFLHLPIIGLLQTAFTHLSWPLGLKFVTVLLATAAVCLATYEAWVRYSFVGGILSGARKHPPRFGLRRLGLALGTATGLLAPLLAGVWCYRDVLWNNNFHPVRANQVYRSARMPAQDIEGSAARFGLQSVVCLCGGRQLPLEQHLCEKLHVGFYFLELDADRLPSRDHLAQLVATLDACRHPVLLHDCWGMERASLAAAVADLLAGAGPPEALEQFNSHHGHFGAAPQARVVQDYQRWLTAHACPHSPDCFRCWVRTGYAP